MGGHLLSKQEQLRSTTATADEDVNWGDVFKKLVTHGTHGLGLQLEDAKQAAQEALCRHFDPDYADWDRSKYPKLLDFLGSVMNGIVNNMRNRKGYLRERLTKGGILPDPPDGVVSPETQVANAEQAWTAVSKLLDCSDGDELVQKLVFKMQEGIDTAADQAEALSVPVEIIYKARERLKAHYDAVKAMMGGG